MKNCRIISVGLFAVTLLVGCRSTVSSNPPAHPSDAVATEKSDKCHNAVMHYETADLPSSEIVEMFQQMAKEGDARGSMWIARLYYLGRGSLPKRPDLAQNMAKDSMPEVMRLAEKGDPEAQFLLGSAYQLGLAVEQDLQKAVEWYTKAVAGEHITAMNNLAVMLARGHATKPDIDKARLLFSHAAKLGSRGASSNLSTYGPNGRDGRARLQALRAAALVRTLGMQKDEGIDYLTRSGLISNPKGSKERDHNERKEYHFRGDGIVLDVDVNGRIMGVEGHAKGFRDSDQFRGEIPLGVTWNTTLKSALQALDTPDDRGYVQRDEAYGLAYRIENLTYAVMFSYDGDYKLKVWRAFENWATEYSNPQEPELHR